MFQKLPSRKDASDFPPLPIQKFVTNFWQVMLMENSENEFQTFGGRKKNLKKCYDQERLKRRGRDQCYHQSNFEFYCIFLHILAGWQIIWFSNTGLGINFDLIKSVDKWYSRGKVAWQRAPAFNFALKSLGGDGRTSCLCTCLWGGICLSWQHSCTSLLLHVYHSLESVLEIKEWFCCFLI